PTGTGSKPPGPPGGTTAAPSAQEEPHRPRTAAESRGRGRRASGGVGRPSERHPFFSDQTVHASGPRTPFRANTARQGGAGGRSRLSGTPRPGPSAAETSGETALEGAKKRWPNTENAPLFLLAARLLCIITARTDRAASP